MYQLSIIEINFFAKHSLLAKMSSVASDDIYTCKNNYFQHETSFVILNKNKGNTCLNVSKFLKKLRYNHFRLQKQRSQKSAEE